MKNISPQAKLTETELLEEDNIEGETGDDIQVELRLPPETKDRCVYAEELPPTIADNFRAIAGRCAGIAKNIKDALLTERVPVEEKSGQNAYRTHAKERLIIRDSKLARALKYRHRNKIAVAFLSVGLAVPAVKLAVEKALDPVTQAEKTIDTINDQTEETGKTVTFEVCDGLDNNGNGRIDEGVDFFTDSNNCGTCGKTCSQGQTCLSGSCTR